MQPCCTCNSLPPDMHAGGDSCQNCGRVELAAAIGLWLTTSDCYLHEGINIFRRASSSLEALMLICLQVNLISCCSSRKRDHCSFCKSKAQQQCDVMKEGVCRSNCHHQREMQRPAARYSKLCLEDPQQVWQQEAIATSWQRQFASGMDKEQISSNGDSVWHI